MFYFTFLELGGNFSGKDSTIWPCLMVMNEHLSNENYISKIVAHPKSIGSQLQLFEREEGCMTPTCKGVQAVWISVLAIAADAPAAGWLLGRNQSFSKAHQICRSCNATQKDRLTHVAFLLIYLVSIGHDLELTPQQEAQVSSSNIQLLTEELDQQQRRDFADARTNAARDAIARKTGVRRCRHFMYWAQHIHVSRCTVQDGMHVLLEGLVKYLMYLTFHWLVHTHKVSLHTINYMITHHRYLPQEKLT